MPTYPLKKLSEICKIKTGKKDVNEGNPNGKFPFFTCAREHTFSDSYSFDMEALLIAGNGDVGHVQYYKGKFEAYQRTYIVHDFNSAISVQYLFLYLSSFLKETVSKQKLGNTMPYIKLGMLTEFQIPLPPLSVQEEIVAKLDASLASIDEAKIKTEQTLAATRELWESTLEEVFRGGEDGEERRLEEVCDISSKLVDPKEEKYQSLLHVGGANIESRTGKLIDLKTAKEEKLISGKFVFDESMVLYSKIRPYLIKIARPDFVGLCSADIYPLSPKKKILNKDFLYFLLLSSGFTEYAIKGSARAGMPKVNREHLFEFSFFLPSLSEQSRIVAHLDAVRAETGRLASLYEQKLADLDELRRSVLQEAFV